MTIIVIITETLSDVFDDLTEDFTETDNGVLYNFASDDWSDSRFYFCITYKNHRRRGRSGHHLV